jgi:hypothetical protein
MKKTDDKHATKAEEIKKLAKVLDMRNQGDMLLATREDLLKCKIRDSDISEHTIN